MFVIDILLDQIAAVADDGEGDIEGFVTFEEGVLVGFAVCLEGEFHDGLDEVGFVVGAKEGDGEGSEEGVGRFGDGVVESGELVEFQLFV